MPRIGSVFLSLTLFTLPALAEDVRFSMSVDRQKVGTEDTFTLEIIVGGAPHGAAVRFPTPPSFEILGRAVSDQMSFSAGAGGAGIITSLKKHTFTMRALKTGKLTIPPAILSSAGREYRTNSITLEVLEGRLGGDRPRRHAAPFGLPPGFGFPDDDMESLVDPEIPTSDSDLFLRATLDKTEAVVGEQLTYSLHIYARLDLSSVDNVKPPKLDGFYSADVRAPTTLMPEQRLLNGVPYRQYLLRSRAIFPLKPGTITIEPAEADITTGNLFASRRVSRTSNAVTVKVGPLPPGGQSGLVGQWRLGREVSQSRVSLGDPLQVKVRVQGKGNLQAVQLPALNAPAAFRTYDPETKDSTETKGHALMGQRTVEYTLLPQQTGTFVLPAMRLEYFDPEAKAWETSSVEPITITVEPAKGGSNGGGSGVASLEGAKNQLVGGGLKSLRHTASFVAPGGPLWNRPWFLPVTLAPLIFSLVALGFGLVRQAAGQQSPEALKRQQAKAAHQRLVGAQRLATEGSTADFYAEVEHALVSFLEAKLSAPLKGLTRPELTARLDLAGVASTDRDRIAAVFELCDLGRYAPGMGETSARKRALEEAARAMEGWPA